VLGGQPADQQARGDGRQEIEILAADEAGNSDVQTLTIIRGVEAFDDAIVELGSYAVEPAIFTYDSEGDDGSYAVPEEGDESDVVAIRHALNEIIGPAISAMTAEDAARLRPRPGGHRPPRRPPAREDDDKDVGVRGERPHADELPGGDQGLLPARWQVRSPQVATSFGHTLSSASGLSTRSRMNA
jgi:hypothetical protein